MSSAPTENGKPQKLSCYHCGRPPIQSYGTDAGTGVPQDSQAALKWVRKAAEQNEGIAQLELGSCYERGIGVPQDSVEAVKWYRKAAEQGEGDAQYVLANRYYYGQDMPRDHVEAIKWCRKAAEQGHSEAQFMPGVLLCAGARGSGRPDSNELAEGFAWLRRAAERGSEQAAVLLQQLKR